MAEGGTAAPGRGEDGLAPFDPFVPEFAEDPYRFYARYRSAGKVQLGAPALPGTAGTYYVLGHRAVLESLRSPDFVRNPPDRPAASPMPDAYRPFWEMAGRWMLFRDPPDHTRLRSLVQNAFTPKVVARLEPRIEGICSDLLDRLEGSRRIELIRDFAHPLPVIVIAELLGVPAEDRVLFRDWSDSFAKAIDARTSPDVYLQASLSTQEIRDYLLDIIRQRRREPREDLLSALIAVESEGDRLTEEELIATAVLLLVAGHETTVNLIGNGTLALLTRRQWEELDPDDESLMENAVEELLRYDAPVQMTFRYPAREVAVDGVVIPPGGQVAFVLGSANRDPEQYREPDRLDISRKVGRHASFGMGIHFCLGAPLARVEARIALSVLRRRYPDLRTVEGRPRWRPMVAFRGLEELPLEV